MLATAVAALMPLQTSSKTSYRESVLSRKPAGYWRLGEAQGTTARDETQSHDGMYHGKVTYGQRGALRGDPDTSIRLDGKDSYVEVADDLVFSQPASGQGLTVEAWMRPDVLAFDSSEGEPYVHWLGKGEGGQYEWGFRFYSKNSDRPNRISAYIWNLTGGLGAGAYFQDELSRREWVHVVACYAPGSKDNPGAGVSIYKNGVLRGGPDSHPPQPGARYSQYNIVPAHGIAPVRFGTRDLKSFFRGGLDEIAIYPRVLSASEISENYRIGSSP
jgi:hypothetical protein